MTDNNGYSGGDFKRNAPQNDSQHQQDGEDATNLNAKAGEYMRELLGEKVKLDQSQFPLSTKLIDQEVVRVQANGRVPPRDQKYVDVYREKSMKVVAKVLVPVKEHPKFNFVGKLLGPKGNTLKQLQEDTMCKMAVLGRGSMRDKQKEEELRNSLDPKYAHLSDELHVEVSALGPPAEAHARMAYALAEVRKYLMPDTNDFRHNPMMYDMGEHGGRAPPPPPPHRAPPRLMPAKTKVYSILDRTRSVMDDTYGYEDAYEAPEPPVSVWMSAARAGPSQRRGAARAAPDADYYGYERGPERFYEDEPVSGHGGQFKVARGAERAPRAGAAQGARQYARAAPYARPGK